LKRDHKDQFRFAALQSDYAKSLKDLPKNESSVGFETLLFLKEDRIYIYADASLEILSSLGGIWSVAKVLKIFPKRLRDAVYLWISRNRYKWFGKKDACPIPDVSQRKKFLN
jgi:predicted DCC family thiol-disulfide oxidoreductase YuxK